MAINTSQSATDEINQDAPRGNRYEELGPINWCRYCDEMKDLQKGVLFQFT
jgi:hypothetical protein